MEYPLSEQSAAHFAKVGPVVMMHSRGPAAENKDNSAYDYAKDSDGRGAVVEGARVELDKKVEEAVKGSGAIRRWLVMVAPGMGFSKTTFEPARGDEDTNREGGQGRRTQRMTPEAHPATPRESISNDEVRPEKRSPQRDYALRRRRARRSPTRESSDTASSSRSGRCDVMTMVEPGPCVNLRKHNHDCVGMNLA
ncbi:hypothetical protein LXA43DRAFT_1133081 [Ganoderma leucocontextum]|nr:hypothetical protein LXA43DRAFT_1133081 [Ganoderma leucocontextum]